MEHSPFNQGGFGEIDKNSDSDFLNDFDIDKLLYILTKNIFWVFLIIISFIIGAYLYLRWTPSVFQARSILKLEYQSSQHMLSQSGMDLMMGENNLNSVNMAGEIELIRSDIMYDAVLDSLNLDLTYYAEGEVRDTEQFRNNPFRVEQYEISNNSLYGIEFHLIPQDARTYQLSYDIGGQTYYYDGLFSVPIEIAGGKLTIASTSAIATAIDKPYIFTVNSRRGLYSYLSKNLGVAIDNQKASTLIISFSSFNKDKSTAIVDAFNKNYKQKTLEHKMLVHDRSLEYLKNQLRLTKDSLDIYEENYISKIRGKGITSYINVEEVINNIKLIEDQLFELRAKRHLYERLKSVVNSDSSIVYAQVLASSLQSDQLNSSIETLFEVEKELSKIKITSTESTMAYTKRMELLQVAKSEFNELLNFSKTSLDTEINKIEGEMYELKKYFYDNISGDPELKRIEKRVQVYKNNFNLITEKIIEINLAKAGTVENSRIISPPYASSDPIFPNQTKTYAVSVGFGIFLSISFIIIKYLLMNKINSLRQVENRLNIPILGVVPRYHDKMEASQLLVHLNPKSSISEAFRSIRTNLDFLNTEGEQKVISVTSTIGGEGKTLVSVNLGGVIAMSDAKVILLDTDLRKPKVHLAFNALNGEGVSSLLINKSTLKDCIRDTDIPGLKYMSAGPIPPNPSELIMSKKFDELLEELKQEFDVVILDTPPVGLVTDGMIAMKKVNLPIYVSRAEYSHLSFLKNPNQLATDKKFKNLSFILNDVPPRKSYYGYINYSGGTFGYYGGNNYGYYDVEPQKKSIWRFFKRK